MMNNNYILGSHNSWSYLKPRKWWMRLLAFTARCQNEDIPIQMACYNVRCFDLRVRFDKNGNVVIAHGMIEYDYTEQQLMNDLAWLSMFNGIYVRVLHEVRTKSGYSTRSIKLFRDFCEKIQTEFPAIKFWCGRNLYDWGVDYDFGIYPTCDEQYSSVCKPLYIDDWCPRLYAVRHNWEIVGKGTDKDILMIDFVNEL